MLAGDPELEAGCKALAGDAKASRAALIEMMAASNVLSIRLGSAAACGEVGKMGTGDRVCFATVMLQARLCKGAEGKLDSLWVL